MENENIAKSVLRLKKMERENAKKIRRLEEDWTVQKKLKERGNIGRTRVQCRLLSEGKMIVIDRDVVARKLKKMRTEVRMQLARH